MVPAEWRRVRKTLANRWRSRDQREMGEFVTVFESRVPVVPKVLMLVL